MADSSTAGSRVAPLELFFDLVFVFTITQVAVIVEHHPSWDAAAQAALELFVIYWMYGGYAWLTNSVGAHTTRRRLALLLGMAAFLVVSIAVPRAFGEDGVAFGVAYLALTLVHLVSYLLSGQAATVKVMVRLGATNVLAALLILAAGIADNAAHWPLWCAAVAVQWAPAIVRMRSGDFVIDVEHFAERRGLMIIIVLGESLVSVALGATELTVDGPLVVGALCGLAASAAFWWAYFAHDADDAASEFARRPPAARGSVALLGYDLPHIVMMAGVVAVAAGSRLSLPDLTEPTDLAAAVLLAGGGAVYLAALALFRFAVGYASGVPRLVGAALCVALIPVGTSAGAAQLLAGLAAITVLVLLVEGLGPRFRAGDLARRPRRAG